MAKETPRLLREHIKAATGNATSRFKYACDIDPIAVSAKKKPWVVMFVFSLFSWLSQHLYGRYPVRENDDCTAHRRRTQRIPWQSMRMTKTEVCKMKMGNHLKNMKMWRTTIKEESDTTRVLTDQYYELKYGSESSTNSDSTYKSAGLPKDVTIRYGT